MEREDETLEIVDEAGQVTGLASRARCHSDPTLLHRAVHVLVFNARGELLLQRRAPTKRIQPGRWDSSVGGHVDPRETWEQAALREMAEEIGLRDIGLELLHQYVWRSPVESELVRTFRALHEGPFAFKADEISEGRFFSLEELRALVGKGTLTPNLEHELGLLGLSRPK